MNVQHRFKIFFSVLFAALLVFATSAQFLVFAEETDIEINEVNFPDEIFRSFIAYSYDEDGNHYLSQTELEAVESISFYNTSDNFSAEEFAKIRDITGINFFYNLKELICVKCKISNLELSNLSKLETVSCSYDSLLVDVNITNCDNIKLFDACHAHSLTSLDLSNLSNLTNLNCVYDGMLNSINLSNCKHLKELICCHLPLTMLNISNSKELEHIECFDTYLSNLDVSNFTNLSYLYCGGPYFTSLNVSGCVNLEKLNCMDSSLLTSLDISDCVSLRFFDCRNNQLTSLDVKNCSNLYSLNCNDNKLTSLDVRGCTKLTELMCYRNNLTSLDLSSIPNDKYTGISTFDNFYTITVPNSRTFNLNNLPFGFDVTKASNWIGGTVDNNILTIDEDATEVTYEYDTGYKYNGSTFFATFKLLVTNDLIAPTASISYSNTEITNHDVIVTITVSEEIQEIDGWNLSDDKKVVTKTYFNNVQEDVTICDLAGNSIVETIKVENIDKENPVCQVLYTTTSNTNGNVTVTVTANEAIQPVEGWILSDDKMTLTKIVTENETSTVIIRDLAGNETIAEYSVNNRVHEDEKPNDNNSQDNTQDNTQNMLSIWELLIMFIKKIISFFKAIFKI